MSIADNEQLNKLKDQLSGELKFDDLTKRLYATDASVYRVLPAAVAFPKDKNDIKTLIAFAGKYNMPLIPRTAGTSLAGQVVGEGIIVDVSVHMNKILEFNKEEGWARVQPGVVRDELNAYLQPHGCFFSPITATANRAMMGGMVGNNSCGTNSIVYGSTRDHTLEIEAVLSNGEDVTFNSISKDEFQDKCKDSTLEGQLYKHIEIELNNKKIRKNIEDHFPRPSIHRRNTGYAVDALLDTNVFKDSEKEFNLCNLLCGSEGTLAFMTEMKLDLDPLPPSQGILIACHFNKIYNSLKATQEAMKLEPSACELMDKIILDCTKENIEQRKNRYFVEGDPEALLLVEFRAENLESCLLKGDTLISKLKEKGLGYAFPIIPNEDIAKVWKLRAAGLGLLANIPGDKKAVACIEDTAVKIADLADYIQEFTEMLEGHCQKAVYYAHAGAGEIHLRPILNLKDEKDIQEFYEISLATAKLVKKYKGSLSGEHGDGRLRAPFISLVMGEENYNLFQRIKKTWDPQNIFNPGKIVNAPPMNESLRYAPGTETKDINTIFDFSPVGGILRAVEKCNGSGDCRKLPVSGGTMCPSYQATRDERNTTRGRANTLREYLTSNTKENPFNHEEIKEVMDLCLSCKGCTSECPSNIDMTALKAEFQYNYYKTHGVPLRSKIFANYNKLNAFAAKVSGLSNFLISNSTSSMALKKMIGIAPQRSLPSLSKVTFRNWYKHNYKYISDHFHQERKVYLFCDEFTNYNDAEIGENAVQLLVRCGYHVQMVHHPESGRAAISKGVLDYAQELAEKQVDIFSPLISEETPLLGIEPSSILSFRDEYPRLLQGERKEKAIRLKENVVLIDEFISKEIQAGRILEEWFSDETKTILLHGHCHQKSLSSVDHSVWMMSLPKNYNVQVIPSGCCGMAGSFGFEKEHYEVSQKIGEMVLFPAVRKVDSETIIAAPGTSCRHQIKDGTGRIALHPVEVLYDAMK